MFRVILLCSLARKCAGGRQVVGKFLESAQSTKTVHVPNKLIFQKIIYVDTNMVGLECVKVPMPAHQSLPLTAYIFEASYSTSTMQAKKI